MTVAVWPTTLPTELLQRGYQQGCADVSLRSSVDTGPAKIRRRYTAGVQQVKGVLKLSEAQLGYIRTFYDTTLVGGTLRFTWKDPVTMVSKELRFISPVTWSMTGGWYDVNLDLELLP